MQIGGRYTAAFPNAKRKLLELTVAKKKWNKNIEGIMILNEGNKETEYWIIEEFYLIQKSVFV